jgi:hypothetical protein
VVLASWVWLEVTDHAAAQRCDAVSSGPGADGVGTVLRFPTLHVPFLWNDLRRSHSRRIGGDDTSPTGRAATHPGGWWEPDEQARRSQAQSTACRLHLGIGKGPPSKVSQRRGEGD